MRTDVEPFVPTTNGLTECRAARIERNIRVGSRDVLFHCQYDCRDRADHDEEEVEYECLRRHAVHPIKVEVAYLAELCVNGTTVYGNDSVIV